MRSERLFLCFFVIFFLFSFMSIKENEKAYPVLEEAVLNGLPPEEGYYYGCMNKEEKKVYREMAWCIGAYERGISLSTDNKELLNRVFNAVLNDHPEFFYVEGYSFITFSHPLKQDMLVFSPEYNRSFSRILEDREGIEEYAEEFDRNAPSEGDYEKVRYAYDYLITRTEYELKAPDSQNICSVFLNGKSVCSGYSRALQFLLERLGISAFTVTGYVGEGENHAWVIASVNGQYYHIDPTWGDASYTIPGESVSGKASLPEVNYDYFLINDTEISRSHIAGNEALLPRCDSLKDNYYVREGAYFESLDKAKLEELFKRAYGEGRETVSFKCSDEEVYVQMHRYLLEEQHIFDHIRDQNTASYADKELSLSYLFWL